MSLAVLDIVAYSMRQSFHGSALKVEAFSTHGRLLIRYFQHRIIPTGNYIPHMQHRDSSHYRFSAFIERYPMMRDIDSNELAPDSQTSHPHTIVKITATNTITLRENHALIHNAAGGLFSPMGNARCMSCSKVHTFRSARYYHPDKTGMANQDFPQLW